MLMNLNVRMGIVEKALQEIQLNQMELTRLIQQQNGLIKQLQHSDTVLSEAVNTCLQQQQHLLNQNASTS